MEMERPKLVELLIQFIDVKIKYFLKIILDMELNELHKRFGSQCTTQLQIYENF